MSKTVRIKIICTFFLVSSVLFGSPPWQDDYQIALNAIKDKNYKLASVILNDLLKKTEANPGREGIYYHLALSFYGLERFEEAQSFFEKVVKLDSNSAFFARSLFYRGEIFREKKKFNDSLKDLTEFTAKFPKEEYVVKAYLSIADIYKEIGQEDDERSTYEEALEKYPNHEFAPYLHYQYGKRQYERSKYKMSIKIFKDIILNSKMKTYQNADLISDSEIFIGRNLMGLGELKNAQKQFSYVLEKYPKDEEKAAALYFSGEAFFLSLDEKKGFEAWQKVREKFPKTEWAKESYLSESRFFKKKKNYDQAILVLKNFSEKNPNHSRIDDFTLEIAQLHKMKGDEKTAVEYFSKAAKSNNRKKSSYAIFSIAELLEFKELDHSLEKYQQIIKDFSDTEHAPYAIYGMGKVFHKKREFDQCIEKVKELEEKFPDFSNLEYALLLKADSLSGKEMYSEALVLYNQLKKSKDKNIRLQSELGIGWVYADKKMYARAESIFLALMKGLKNDEKYMGEVNHALGIVRFNLKLYANAKENFKAVLYESGDNSSLPIYKDSLFRMGLLEFRTGNFSDALSFFKKAAQKDYERQAESLYYKGLTEKKLKLLNESIASFTESIQNSREVENSIKANSYFQRGLGHLELEKINEGLADLRLASSLNEEISDDSQFELAKYYLLKDLNQSIKEFKLLKDRFPNSPFIVEFYFNLADLYRSKNQNEDAEEIYQTIEKDYGTSKKSDTALLLLADGYFRKGDYSKSRKTCERYLKAYPDYDGADDCLFKISDIIEKEKSTKEKIDFLKKNKSLFSEKRKYDYLLKLAESAVEIGNYKEAKTILNVIPAKDKSIYKKHFFLGLISDREKNYEAAYKYYQFVDLHSDGEFAVKSLLRMGRFDLIAKRYSDAIKKYSKLIYQYSAYKEEYAESLFFLSVIFDRIDSKEDSEKYKMKLSNEGKNTRFGKMSIPAKTDEISYED